MTTAALVGVTTGVMKPLLSKLTKLLEEEYVKLKGVRKQIKFLRDELSAMSIALEILADAEQLDPEKRDWRDKLRELAYDIEDCVDSFMARVHLDEPKGIKGFFRRLKRLKARHNIANEIEELMKRATDVNKRHKRYNFAEPLSNSSTSAIDPHLPALYEEIDRLVGIGGPKKQIIELLDMGMNGSSAKLKVISIAGYGGLGKTTLAKQVYDIIRSQFSCTAFVSVSRSPDVRKILRHIAGGVGFNDIKQDDEEQQLIDKLRKHLQDKRYLIVIDDVWDAKPWETIKLALLNNNCGSRIIITTRIFEVASFCSSQGGYVHKMEPLSFDDSKRLLFKRAFGSENLCCTHLGSAPDEILRKCGGLPLAIITISSLLTDQHAKGEWDRVLNDIGYALAKNPGAENMTNMISLSYFDIPHHLRTCLLYLSAFPEDFVIEKQHLIHRWIAEGFIHEEERRTRFEIGERYFNNLINRSMIQPVDVKYGQPKACKVHDIILDYIKCKAAEENFLTSLDSAEHIYTSEYKVRKLCINNYNVEIFPLSASLVMSHVRSFTIFGHPGQTSLSHFTVLRVLDLGYCKGIEDHHLKSIEKLFNLTYLRLSSSLITKLPEIIGELQYLQTLDLRGTRTEKLPPSITKLHSLAHLFVDWMTTFPEGMVGQMHSLEELRQYGVYSYEQGKSLQEFSKLTKLRTLKIKWEFYYRSFSEIILLRSCIGNVLSSSSLQSLYISHSIYAFFPLSLDSWQPAACCRLRKLCMKRTLLYKVPNWMELLGNLVVLKLHIICMSPQDVEILGAIPSLHSLELDTAGGTRRRITVHGSSGFRSLKYFSLSINYCGTALEFEPESMPKLEHLYLFLCMHNRNCLNGASNLGIEHLSSLTNIEVKILGYCWHGSYDPTEDKDDGIIRCVASHIKAAVGTLPNRPTIRFGTDRSERCEHFEYYLKEANQYYDGILTEWLKIWQIDDEQIAEVTAGWTKEETYERSQSRELDETNGDD